MMDLERHGQDEPICPKRLWVMTVLSDDESLAQDGTLPRGLRFHLSRCASCRVLAGRLMEVSAALRSLSILEPDPGLSDRAEAQVLTALREGARLTGRVSIPDEPDSFLVSPAAGGWRRGTRYAAAAVILLAVGLWGLSVRRGPAGSITVEGPGPPPTHMVLDDSEEDSGDHVEVVAVSGSPAVGPSAVESTSDDRGLGRSARRPCRYHSHVEAAFSDDPSCIHRAVVFPRPRSPGSEGLGNLYRVWAVFREFDSPPDSGSTKRRRNDE